MHLIMATTLPTQVVSSRIIVVLPTRSIIISHPAHNFAAMATCNIGKESRVPKFLKAAKKWKYARFTDLYLTLSIVNYRVSEGISNDIDGVKLLFSVIWEKKMAVVAKGAPVDKRSICFEETSICRQEESNPSANMIVAPKNDGNWHIPRNATECLTWTFTEL